MIQQKVAKKKNCFNAHFQYSHSQIRELNNMWPLENLAM